MQVFLTEFKKLVNWIVVIMLIVSMLIGEMRLSSVI
jgi:hypothetical protein